SYVHTFPLHDSLPILENAGTDQSISFVNPGSGVMAITVEGDAEDVSKLSSENFRLFIDVSDRDEGEHQLPVTLEGPDGVTSSSRSEEHTSELQSRFEI